MSRYFPVLWYVIAAACVLVLAGFGASGTLRGALRYVGIWAKLVIGTMAVAAVLWLVIAQFMPSP